MLGKRGLINKIREKHGRKVILTGALAAMLMVGGASAYFTDTEAKDNTWTVGSVDLQLIEEAYDKAPDERVNITPNKKLSKDPLIKNTGSNDAFVFMKFTVPKADVKVASEDGRNIQSGMQELFSYIIDSNWTQISKEETSTGNTYVYAYGTASECTKLKPNASTSVIFKDSKIKFKNVIEGQGLEHKTLELPVEAYAIQTNDITEAGHTDPASVWAVLNGEVEE
ncbi:MAG: TasA family protein [Firmicutes bacterium]|nr:TasA family protein [Bacillota bacterium]